MRLKSFICGLIIFFLTPIVIAQEVHHLDLAKCMEIATENNFMMRSLKEELSAAGFQLTSATNRFKTNVDMSMLLPQYDETIVRDQDSLGVHYYNIRQLNFSGSLSINQPLPTDGRLSLRSQLIGLEDFELYRNNIRLITGFYLEQPLEAIYSFNRIQAGFREAELNYERSQKRYIITELDLKYQVSDAFYRLVAAIENEKISKEILQMQREATQLAQNKYQAGVIAEVEALQMEIDLAEEENLYDLAILNRNDMANALKQMLDLPLVDSLAIESDLTYTIVEADLEKALESGLKHRLELRDREIERELADIQIRRTRVGGQITGSLSAFYIFSGVGEDTRDTQLYNTIQGAWNELKRRPGDRGFALNIHIPIWDWGVNWANVQAARANLNQTQIALDQERVNIEREIRNTVAQLSSSLRRLQILEKNVKLARKNFNINNQRYTNGEINSQALALDRTRLSQANISHLQAYFDYKLVILDLMRKTFYDFENDKPLFAD
jgi:outer membrane protein TolC